MKHTNVRRLIVLTVFGLIATTAALALPARGSQHGLSFVQVTEKEWSLTLSRTRVPPGKVSLEVLNFGTDNHDLVLRKNATASARSIRFSQIEPQDRAERMLALTRGTYALWCSLPGHKTKGMRATLTVK